MKSSLALYFILCLTLLACQPNTEQNQQATEVNLPVASATLSEPVNISEKYLQPNELVYSSADDEGVIVTKFYPIGWGVNGEFAYLTEPADEACGCYFLTANIIDNQGQELWKWEYNSSELQEPLQVELADVWQQYANLIQGKLKEYGISQQTSWIITPNQFDDNGKRLIVNSKIQKGNSEVFAFDVVKQSEFYLNDNSKEKERVTKKHDEYDLILSEELIGVLRHPSQKRLVAIAKTTQHGFEPPPNVLSFYLVGFEWD